MTNIIRNMNSILYFTYQVKIHRYPNTGFCFKAMVYFNVPAYSTYIEFWSRTGFSDSSFLASTSLRHLIGLKWCKEKGKIYKPGKFTQKYNWVFLILTVTEEKFWNETYLCLATQKINNLGKFLKKSYQTRYK